MRCLLCERWSFRLVCKECQRTFLRPRICERKLFGDFKVYSFYPYSEIKELLLTKHSAIGRGVYKILAQNSLRLFAKKLDIKANVIPVDDRIDGGYSHTAILANSMRTSYLTPRFASLRAKNRVNYSGKSLAYRLKNPRDFRYSGPKEKIILVDDIVTTGTTLKEAYSVCYKEGAEVLFALVLADARE